MTVIFEFGLVHAPLTPFAKDGIDYETYGKLLDFHIRHGAEALALPMHAGESVSLTVSEREQLLEFAVRHVAGRVPVLAHVSEAGTEISASLAAHAKKAGAAALIATVPYYWTPPQPMLVEHFRIIGKAGALPFFVLNAPFDMANVEFAPKSVVELIKSLPECTGLIDTSLDWQYMIEVVTVARAEKPVFQFVSGTEYMISAAAIGATGLLSPLASIAPQLVGELYRLCRQESYQTARPLQEDAAVLFRLLRDTGVGGLKAAARRRGRPCGEPRPPLVSCSSNENLFASLSAVNSMRNEPYGWS
jgi:dihydrodipicolinate synthase/N-acetylneuraminate lyase